MESKLDLTTKNLAHYMCLWCDSEFVPEANDVRCPSCGVTERKDLIPIYMVDNEEQSLFCPVDSLGG